MTILTKIDLCDVSNALDELADAIEFITTGKADDLQDRDAWDVRANAGRQIVRLRAMLSPESLDLSSAYGSTQSTLEGIWSLVELLGYGSHTSDSDSYRGPLHLPNEVGPDGQIRKFDEAVDVWPGGFPENAPSKYRNTFMETKRESWSFLIDEFRMYSELLAGSSEVPAGTTGQVGQEPSLPFSTAQNIKKTHLPIHGGSPPETKESSGGGLFASQVAIRLGKCTTRTIGKWAAMAGIDTPERGGKNHVYPFGDLEILCRYLIKNCSTVRIVDGAHVLLAEINGAKETDIGT